MGRKSASDSTYPRLKANPSATELAEICYTRIRPSALNWLRRRVCPLTFLNDMRECKRLTLVAALILK
jgi:hypothetical protein